MRVYEKAYAKVNLFLDVTARREDGFHDVDTLMRSVTLHDDISLTAVASEKNRITVFCNAEGLETDHNNLVYKSALKYLQKNNITAEVKINLIKRIPIGAGLGGGSSDAAATLRAMNRIFGLSTEDELLEMASELGSDVPFCINGVSAFCTGRGEKLRTVDISSTPYVVIAIGEGRVSTPRAYALLDEKYGDFKRYNDEKKLPDIATLPFYYNIFESVIDLEEIADIKSIMRKHRSTKTLMSGSGPSVFGEFKGFIDASLAVRELKKCGYFAFKCRLK